MLCVCPSDVCFYDECHEFVTFAGCKRIEQFARLYNTSKTLRYKNILDSDLYGRSLPPPVYLRLRLPMKPNPTQNASMTQGTPPLLLSPLQRHSPRPSPQPRQETMPPLPYPVTRIKSVSGPVPHLYICERWMKRYLWQKVKGWW